MSGLAVRVVEKSHACFVKSTSVTSRNADWEPHQRGGVQLVKQLHGVDDVAKAKADYEGDKYAKSAVESASHVCCGGRQGPVCTASSLIRSLWTNSNCLVRC